MITAKPFNSTARPATSTEPVASLDTKHPRRRNRFRRKTASILMVAVLGAGSVALGATPAQAATSSTATVCFRHTGGQAYTYEVYPMVYVNGSWQIFWNTPQRSASGCTSWPLPTGQYWAFRAYTRAGTTYWIGTSGSSYISSGYSYNYGTSIVTQARY